MIESIRFHQIGCEMNGSPFYGRLLGEIAADWEAGGITSELLPASWERPLQDAAALRLLGAVHRIVLDGRALELARFYRSAGGDDEGDAWPAFVRVLEGFRPEIEQGLREHVQTNEIGRAAVLAGGFTEIARRTGLPLALFEVGCSAGLNLRWDRYAFDTGLTVAGDASSALRFAGVWEGAPPDLSIPVRVVERRGCDISPIDPSSPEGARRLESFIWPDQDERLARLRAAVKIARETPVAIERADAGAWVTDQLARRRAGLATVVYHSIVLQYVPRPSRHQMSDALFTAGENATPDAPVAWLRMEPAGEMADLRLRLWPGGEDEVLAECGYHGRPIRWRG
jgi:hypothetical protein